MQNLIRRFRADESGAEMIEWAVVTIVLLVATVPVLILLKSTIIATIREILEAMQEDPEDTFVPTP